MADIVLISPKYDMNKVILGQKEEMNGKQRSIQLSPPLGLAYLASFLEQEGFNVKIIDAAVGPVSPEGVATTIEEIRPPFVGIHVTSFLLYYTRTLIKKIKEKLETTIIVGGPHITHAPESTFKLGADYGIAGEGERGLTLLMKSFNNNWNPDVIPGLIWKENAKLKTNSPDYIENLDELPFPARHLLPMDSYYHGLCPGKVATIITSRGCPYSCIFCATTFAKSYRAASSQTVVREIEELINKGIRWVKFEDDVFTLKKARVEEICGLILEKGLNFRWICNTRTDLVNERLLKLMEKAGCRLVMYGVESGVERIRSEIIKKRINNDLIEKIFKQTKEAGMRTAAFFMLGHPGERKEDMLRTIDFIREIKPDYIDVWIAMCIPGSKLFAITQSEGKVSADIWERVMEGKENVPIYIPDGISLKEMQKIQRKAFAQFYFNPIFILKRLIEIKGINELSNLTKTGLRTLNLLKIQE